MIVRVALTIAVLVIATLGAPASSSARATTVDGGLLSSSPSADAVLTAPPRRVELRFREAVRTDSATVTLIGPTGDRTPLRDIGGASAVLDVSMPADASGDNAVEWQVTSVAGQTLTGRFVFTVIDGGLKGFMVAHALHLLGGAIMLTFVVYWIRMYRRPAS
ncbi:copper resistance CopC family protein [Micromonospora sp. ZYX-F-536]|uniref:copper resistance CopC family protein n=1 Tax=Micromonospora sp. ZYX-F-536 TaxID=3457629 RepID=UPI00404080B6